MSKSSWDETRRDEDGVQVVIGFYKYVDPDGNPVRLTIKLIKIDG